MCGLVGVAGDLFGTWKDVFSELLLLDVVRGPHSTGAGFVGRGTENFMLAKRPGHPFNLFGEDDFEKAMSVAHPQKVIMGHNRFATVGDKTIENAHPFMFDNVIGAHNGTLDKSCVKDLHNHFIYGTDSQAIFSTINEKSVDEALKLMSGAWALVWFDKRDHTLNMLRNDQRPLHYCYSADRKTLIWASEFEMLEYVLRRKHKPILKGEKGEPVFYQPEANMLYSWEIPNAVTTPLDVPKQRKVEGKRWEYPVYSGPFLIGSKKHKHGRTHSVGTQPKTYFDIVPFKEREKSKKFRPPYKDKYGRIITKVEFLPMVEEGCVFCNANGQEWQDFIYILGPYIGYHTPYMCEECYNSEEQYDIAQYAI